MGEEPAEGREQFGREQLNVLVLNKMVVFADGFL
jgi:hypothetical protein